MTAFDADEAHMTDWRLSRVIAVQSLFDGLREHPAYCLSEFMDRQPGVLAEGFHPPRALFVFWQARLQQAHLNEPILAIAPVVNLKPRVKVFAVAAKLMRILETHEVGPVPDIGGSRTKRWYSSIVYSTDMEYDFYGAFDFYVSCCMVIRERCQKRRCVQGGMRVRTPIPERAFADHMLPANLWAISFSREPSRGPSAAHRPCTVPWAANC